MDPTADTTPITAPWLQQLSGLSVTIIVSMFTLHAVLFLYLWMWYRRDLRVIADALDDFTRGLKNRSILGKASPLPTQIDAFVADISDVLSDESRTSDRDECLRRMHILDERRSYLDSLSFETSGNMARTMIESYPLAGVLGTILAIGAALQSSAGTAAGATTAVIVGRFGDAIWSTFCGLAVAILLMFVNSLLEPRFERLTECRAHVREVVARAKRELSLASAARNPSGAAPS